MKNTSEFIFRTLVSLCAVWIVFIITSFLFSPPVFELKMLSAPKVYTVCPGNTFSYTSQVVVRRKPATLMKTETWFGYAQGNTVVVDRYENVEIFNWDKQVPTTISRFNRVTVPSTDAKGNPITPGKYRYITNLQRVGDPSVQSNSIEVVIPEKCS